MGILLILLPFVVFSATAVSLSGIKDVNIVAELSNQLADAMHKQLSTGDENVFFSPLSISTAVAMLYRGAKGKTEEEMRNALGYEEAKLSDNDVHSAFQNLMELFSEDDNAKEYILYVANAVLTQKDYPILAEYKADLEKIYKATARDVDFQHEGQKAVDEVNEWVKQNTHNQIKKLLDEIDPATVMILLNAVYFKGTWKTQFDPKNTIEREFFNKGLQTEAVKVPMMYIRDYFSYARLGRARAVELPYKGEDISMFILLPDEEYGLSGLEEVFSSRMLKDIKRTGYKTKLHLTLPKFKLEYEKTLNPMLQEMGLKNIFEDSADLRGISEAGAIKVSKVMHKAVVDVNEEGSEASAVTGIQIETLSLNLDSIFNVNRPFMFLIVDKRSNMILFQGRVNNL